MAGGIVWRWIIAFKDGRTDGHDERRNRRASVLTEDLVQKVHE